MNDAMISDDDLYRYWLQRKIPGGGYLKGVFIMLNPSTADASKDDPTIRRCKKFAERIGCGSLVVLNLYAYRATKPTDLLKTDDPVGPENNDWLTKIMNDTNNVICAWGDNADDSRVCEFVKIANLCNVRMWCLGKTKKGNPRHPLYIRSDQPLVRWHSLN